MCLAVPVEVNEILEGEVAIINAGGAKKKISLALLDDVSKGDYVLVHAGFAIEKIDEEERAVFVRFPEGKEAGDVEYLFDEMDELALAYAITVHRSQGSEFPAVVMPVTTQHYIMLKRNLLYTAVTRARELVVLIGDIKALAIAVNNDQVSERYTSLEERLKS